jgi:hypothetical protein
VSLPIQLFFDQGYGDMNSTPREMIIRGVIQECGSSISAQDGAKYEYIKINDKRFLNVATSDDYIDSALRNAVKAELEVELALSKSHGGLWCLAALKRVDSNELFRSKLPYPRTASIVYNPSWIAFFGLIIICGIGAVIFAASTRDSSAGWTTFFFACCVCSYIPLRLISRVNEAASLFNKQRDVLGASGSEEVY